MFNRVRIRLTLLYLGTALALILLMGGGSYLLLRWYFQSTTDLALSYRMVIELRRSGAEIPDDLQAAERAWLAQQTQPTHDEHEDEDEDEDDDHARPTATPVELAPFNAELTPIFVLQLDEQGVSRNEVGDSDIEPDLAALRSARTNGVDWRIVTQPNGVRTRLYTRNVQLDDDDVVAFQIGRLLDDQDQVLTALVGGLLALGTVSAVLMGLGSWWLAGRSLAPAQQAWEQQRIFVANASHELRAPLTLLRASGEMLQRTLPARDTDRHELVTDVLAETDHLTTLVTDLLLLSRLDAGQITFVHEPVDLAELFADIQRKVGRLAAVRGITITQHTTRRIIHADHLRLRQVLLILIDNALRYTPTNGVIQLTARDDNRRVVIEVHDSGSGIPAEHLSRIFDRFYRVDSSRSAVTGSGLGLSIARSLIEGQHGQITINSLPANGTTVSISLPT